MEMPNVIDLINDTLKQVLSVNEVSINTLLIIIAILLIAVIFIKKR